MKNDISKDFVIVSIHVPTRGTTGVEKNEWIVIQGFNPRSHEGND